MNKKNTQKKKNGILCLVMKTSIQNMVIKLLNLPPWCSWVNLMLIAISALANVCSFCCCYFWLVSLSWFVVVFFVFYIQRQFLSMEGQGEIHDEALISKNIEYSNSTSIHRWEEKIETEKTIRRRRKWWKSDLYKLLYKIKSQNKIHRSSRNIHTHIE